MREIYGLYDWEFLDWLERRGHKLFRDRRTERLALCDLSGSTPDTSEDGVLWLDQSKPLVAEPGYQARIIVVVPLLTPDNEPKITLTGVEGAQKLVAHRFKLETGVQLAALVDILMKT